MPSLDRKPARAKLARDTLALTVLLAALTSLGPLSTDMYLPSLPAIASAFGAPVSRVQLTLSGFLFGFAAGQVVHGPLADRLGRRPVLMGGLVLFALATAACALATSVETLALARFFQALGASGPIVLARAVVRDLYEGPRAGRELSRMATFMGAVPAVAPALGGVLETAFGWRASFWVALALGLALLAAVALALPETLRARDPAPLTLRSVLAGYRDVARSAPYRAYVALAALTYGGLFAFISASSYVLQGVYGLAPLAFGLAFGACVVGFVAGTLTASRLVMRLGIDRTLRLGAWLLVAGALAMLAAVLAGVPSPLAVLLPMIVYLAGVGLVLPQANAGAMTPFPSRAGTASSLLGLVQMSFAAVVGLGVGAALEATGRGALPLPIALCLVALPALLVARRAARAVG